jgi:serine/threonine protein kinase
MDKFIGPFRFNMNHMLGRGSYGTVYKGKSQEGYPVAIKVMDKRLLNQVTN